LRRSLTAIATTNAHIFIKRLEVNTFVWLQNARNKTIESNLSYFK